jgi:hypothetical protein
MSTRRFGRGGCALLGLLGMLGGPHPGTARASSPARIDLATPEGVVAANRKIQCSMRDGEPVTYWWFGDMYSRVPGERDRLLFRVEGMNVRQCDTVADPKRGGTGFRYVSRELLLYEDPASGAPLARWHNPWTGEDVDVVQVANDPVNAREATFPLGRDGSPQKWTGRILGNQWWTTVTVPLFYDNPLQGSYQDYVGGKYHAVEMFNSFGDLDDLTSAKTATARVRVGWVRICGWLPWMKMGDRPGEVYFHAAGQKLGRWEELPATLREEIRRHYPAWVAPPPIDDSRPNETSWTYFRKKVAPKGPAAAP